MSDFTQKILQRTQARKEALALKRENLVSGGISSLSNPKGPLFTKDLNLAVNGSRDKKKENTMTAQRPTKRGSTEKVDGSKSRLADKRKKPDVGGGTIQDRLAQLESQKQRFEKDVQERKKERQMEVQSQREPKPYTTVHQKFLKEDNRITTKERTPKFKNAYTPERERGVELKAPKEMKSSQYIQQQENVTPMHTKPRTGRQAETKTSKEINPSSYIVQDGSPTRETEKPDNSGTPISTSVIDRILGLIESDESPPKKDIEDKTPIVKTSPSKDKIELVRISRVASNKTKTKDTTKYYADKNPVLPPKAIKENSMTEETLDTSCSSFTVSEVSSITLDSEQVDRTMYDEDMGDDSYETEDCTGESISEENAFDISGVLRAANNAETKRQLSKQNLLPDEEQEFHILSPMTPKIPITPCNRGGSKASNLVRPDEEVEDMEQLTPFKKQLLEKSKEIKSPAMVNKLECLDQDMSSRYLEMAKEEKDKQISNAFERDNAPVTHKKPTVENESDLVDKEDNGCLNVDVDFSVDIGQPKSLLSPGHSTVRQKSKTKKPARRSVSFSGSRASPKVIFKSGYNEETSAKYNVKSNIGDLPIETKNPSNNEKIQYYLEEAASHQSIVLQASQALNLSYGSSEDRRGCPEVIEGERLLLIATQKRSACLEEVQNLKLLGDPFKRSNKKRSDIVPPCNGSVTLSEINLPLNQDFMMALRAGRMDLGVFHFVVLIQCGPLQVTGTHAVSTYDELNGASLPFKEKLIVKNVPHDFTVTVRVFGMHTKRGDPLNRGKRSASSTKHGKESPGLMKNMLSSLTPKRRANSEDSPGASSPQKTIFRNSSFTLVGETKMTLDTIGNEKFALMKVPSNSPLEGFINAHSKCVPEFSAKAIGFLTLFEDIGGCTALSRRWCVLQNNSISCWRYPGDEETKEPLGKIEFKWCINKSVSILPRDQCARPNTFEVLLRRVATKEDKPSLLATIDGKYVTIKHWLSADNKEDRISWLEAINKLLSDSRAWQVKKSHTKQEYTQSKNSIRMSNRRLKKPETGHGATKC